MAVVFSFADRLWVRPQLGSSVALAVSLRALCFQRFQCSMLFTCGGALQVPGDRRGSSKLFYVLTNEESKAKIRPIKYIYVPSVRSGTVITLLLVHL